MRKLPPSGYKTAALSERPGYLARRMQEYRKRLDEQKAAKEALDSKLVRIERKRA